jgi:endonuclease/exonuclease/phosphatase family metal-dependent hydrolase
VRGTAGGNRGVHPRLIFGVVLAAHLIAAGCVHYPPAEFHPSQVSNLPCRQLDPVDAPSVQWTAPTDPDVSFRLSRWCATVGPVYFISNPRVDDVRPIDRVAIVSWNIHEGRGRVDELIQRLRLGEFTAGEPVVDFVLLLQEAIRREHGVPPTIPDGYPAPRRIDGAEGTPPDLDVHRLAEGGLAVLYAPSMRNGERAVEDRGNAIVSTLALNDPALIELPLERQRRVVIVSSVEGTDRAGQRWHLGLVDVHLDTALALLNGGPFEARRRQVVALLDMLRALGALNASDRTEVMAGDFNTWKGRGEPAIKLLRQEFDGADPIEAATWTGPLGLHATLDQIFVRRAGTRSPIVRLPSKFGSDHYPLLTVLEF